MKLTLTSTAAALLMLSVNAASAQGGPMAAVRQACAADMAKFCPDKTGQERHQCMLAHKDEVSDGCKSAAAAAMKAREEMKADKPQ